MKEKIKCIVVDDESMAREILERHLAKIDSIEILASCENATEAFNLISSQEIDLIFLDINMPGISGISFARSINSSIKIIFTTAYREYAIDGFNLHAVDYLLKPISFERLWEAITHFKDTFWDQESTLTNAITQEPQFIFIRVDRKMVKMNFDQIYYIESLSDYLKIHTAEKFITIREKISAIEEKLSKEQFLRIHRSFIISITQIESFTTEYVVVANQSLPISRSYKEEVLNILNKYQ
ncbi:MAG: LytTR family DNA-binding domain-containing protein [Leeuwenhoekiella sp.]